MQDLKLRMQIADSRGHVARMLVVVCCVLFLACATPPGSHQPVRIQAAPPPSITKEETLASSEETEAVAAEPARPRVMVVVKLIPKDDIIAVTDRMLEPETLENLIADAFQSRGFPVVDPAAARDDLNRDQLRRILEGDDRTAAEVGLGAEADVVVVGSEQESGERRAAQNVAETTDIVRVRLAARAVNTATGVVMGSTLLESEQPFSSDAARRQIADSAVSELSARIFEVWRSRTNLTEIYADNADYQRVQLFKSTIMNEARGVDSVVTRSLDARSAVVEVFSQVTSDELLVQIDHCTTAIPFVVKGFAGNRIDIRFLDAPAECKPELR